MAQTGILLLVAALAAQAHHQAEKQAEKSCLAEALYYEARGERVLPGRVLLTSSTSEAYAYLFKLLTDPGDHVLVPRPSYPLFEFLANLESAEVRQYSLAYHGAWSIDLDSLERALTERTKAIVLVNPNNPTGSYLKRAELDENSCASLPKEAQACHQFNGGMGRGLHAKAANTSDLAGFIENWTDHPVVDRTGLDGLYVMESEGWTPMRLPPPPTGNTSDRQSGKSRSTSDTISP